MSDSPTSPSTVAVIGGGAAGLGAAWLLARGGYAVHLFESRQTAGGHAYTVDIPIPGNATGATIPVDAGFIVYNARTYPDLISLFQMLNVEEENSSMSFAASIKLPSRDKYFEWGSDSPATLFADRQNLYRPSMYTMLYDMRRFNTAVYDFMDKLENDPQFPDKDISLGEFLENGSYSSVFTRCYLIPMVSAVWSASFNAAMAFPARSLFHFFVNHGLAQVFERPQWRTPSGRSREYVTKVINDIRMHSGIVLLGNPVTKVERDTEGATVWSEQCDPKRFNHVVFATHAPVTLELLGDDATPDERRILGAFQYANNKAFIHYDDSLMPTNKTVWSSWNFIGRPKRAHPPTQDGSIQEQQNVIPSAEPEQRSDDEQPSMNHHDGLTRSTVDVKEAHDDDEPVCVTYWLNRLQNYHKHHISVPDMFLTLNPVTPIHPDKILKELTFEHPQFTEEAVRSQTLLQDVIQGKNRSWFCGAFARFGFHEDALMMGLNVAERLSGYQNLRPWNSKHRLVINNNARQYEIPYSPLRTPLIVYLGALLVLNAVMARLRQGLGKIAARMADSDPIVCVAVGDGRLNRFGPSRSRAKRRGGCPSSGPFAPVQSARAIVRNPKVLARIADALRQGHSLAPTAAAAFAASEFDCPTPDDLTVVLKALFIADALDLDPSNARKGRAKLAESLLFSIVGGFKKVTTLPTHTRLPELTTCIMNVVYPSWWLEVDPDATADNGKGARLPAVTMISPRDLRKTNLVLELLGDLSETTIEILQNNEESKATIVLQNPERSLFIARKAEVLFIRRQVEIMLLKDFMNDIRNENESPGDGAEVKETRFDLILSPTLMNNFHAAGFKDLDEMLRFLGAHATSDGVIELGGTVHGSKPGTLATKPHLPVDRYFCGDEGFTICQTCDVIEKAERTGFELQRVAFMDHDEAAMDINRVIKRVYNSLAEDMLEPEETRGVLSQMCLWEAALVVKQIRRMAVSLKLAAHPFRV